MALRVVPNLIGFQVFVSLQLPEGSSLGKTVPCCRGHFPEWGAAVSHQQSMVLAKAGYVIFRSYGEMKMCSPLFKYQEKVFSFVPGSVFQSVMVGFFFFFEGRVVLF